VIRLVAVLLTFATVTISARADRLSDIANFAQSICGDIPEFTLTRNSIQGKVEANSSTLAKLFSGGVSVSASKEKEFYRGIPFEKLPDKIPTVAMCKLELAKLIFSVAPQLDQEKVYAASQRRSDLIAVDIFIKQTWVDKFADHDDLANDLCAEPYTTHKTADLLIREKTLTITNIDQYITTICPAMTKVWTEIKEVCNANIDDLEEIILSGEELKSPKIDFPSKHVGIGCLIGRCVHCRSQATHLDPKTLKPLSSTVEEFEKSSIIIYTTTQESYDQHRRDLFNSFLRSFSRILSGGSDEAFCKKYPIHCV
jgi:hypothetical protein